MSSCIIECSLKLLLTCGEADHLIKLVVLFICWAFQYGLGVIWLNNPQHVSRYFLCLKAAKTVYYVVP